MNEQRIVTRKIKKTELCIKADFSCFIIIVVVGLWRAELILIDYKLEYATKISNLIFTVFVFKVYLWIFGFTTLEKCNI